jgi:hypothetical protein
MSTSQSSPLFVLVQQLQQDLQHQREELQAQRQKLTSLRADLLATRQHVVKLQLRAQSSTQFQLPDPPYFNRKALSFRT